MTDDEKINRAIEEHLALWWTDDSVEAIQSAVGADGLACIQEITSFANAPALWSATASLGSAYQELMRLLRECYAFLSPEAIRWIATGAAYGWK